MAEDSANRSFAHAAISVFILFHLIAITCWAVPWNVSVMRELKELIRPYMAWSGLYQSWDMFAPNPKSIDSYIKAVVFTGDRRMKVWTFPRMEELGFAERYQKERYRKFEETLPEQRYEALRPGVATHVARLFNSQVDPPDKVVLIEFRSDIKPGADESYVPVPKPNVFYEGYIQSGDLR
ncbi:MAG TPA: hypothetical protein VGY94_10800 [Acidobacteriaceae bacterium]|nr:hypothetical protein [Acidobacteriaceae bacterium]